MKNNRKQYILVVIIIIIGLIIYIINSNFNDNKEINKGTFEEYNSNIEIPNISSGNILKLQ